MPRRTLIELAHAVAGLIVTALITKAATWAYPLGRDTLHVIGWTTAALVLVMAIAPLRRAWAIDWARKGSRDD